ncbi:MAG: hypothetical protein E7465_07310 [Ruminococcaceae bacterium]|nr:hypothetical protein [Oscillospiraceae bacterium]
MEQKKRAVIRFSPELADITRKLSDEQFGILMRAVFAHHCNGTLYSGNDPAVNIAFRFLVFSKD